MTENKATVSQNLLPFVPLLYVAWADDVLSPSESEFIISKIDQLSDLDDKDKKTLRQWCDASKIPSEQTFELWRSLISNAIDKEQINQQSLIDLSRALVHTSKNGSTDLNAASQKALEELEDHLAVGFYDLPANIKQQYKTVPTAQQFDTEELIKVLNGRDDEIIKRTKILLQDPIFSYQTLRTKEQYRSQVLSWMKFLTKQGFGALSYPKAHGGQDDMRSYAAVFETLGFHDLSLAIKFGVQFGLFGGSVMQLGTEKHHAQYLKDIGEGNLLGCFAMTESNHGSNVKGLETTATYDAKTDEIFIHTPHELAGKEYIGNALDSRMASVFAQLIVNGENHGVHAVLVPLRDENHELLPGIRIEDNDYKMGLNGVDNGKIWFNHVRVPVEHLLNRFGSIENGAYTSPIESKNKRFFTMLGTLVGGRVCVPRAGLSATKSALYIAIKYAHKRKQFGPEDGEEMPIIEYPSHQKKLMPLLAKTYALDFALQELTAKFADEQHDDLREVETLAAGLKAYSTWHTTKTIQICREACGGKGYLTENRFTDLKADSDIFTTFEGDNTVLLQLVAKGVLQNFRNEFGKGNLMDILKFGLEEFTNKLIKKNPIVVRNTTQSHLRDIQFHIDAFDYRERALTINIGKKMRSLKKKKLSNHEIYLKCQNSFVTLAKAHVETVVIKAIAKVIEKQNNATIKKLLSLMSSLYALNTIDKHMAWYLSNGYIENNKASSIRREIDKLCEQITSYSEQLVEAFDIPASLLGAPIIINAN